MEFKMLVVDVGSVSCLHHIQLKLCIDVGVYYTFVRLKAAFSYVDESLNICVGALIQFMNVKIHQLDAF